MGGDFWERCIRAGRVVVPVILYSDWGEDGNIDERNRIGLRFATIPYGSEVVASGGALFMLEEQVSGIERYHETPEAALAAANGEG